MGSDLEPTKEQYMEEFSSLRPDLFFPESWSPEQKTKAAHLVRPSQTKTGMLASIPMRCEGERCHPAGTLVKTGKRGYIPIEELNEDTDLLVGWNSSQTRIQGGFKFGNIAGYEWRRVERRFSGQLVGVIAEGGKTHECTYDHISFARWSKSAIANTYCLYLQRKGNSWRIGIAKTIYGSGHGGLGPVLRAAGERAEAFWILDVYPTVAEVLMAESYYSTEFGITQRPFIPSGKRYVLTQEQINQHHASFDAGKQLLRAIALLSEFDRRVEYPFWSKGNTREIHGARKVREIRACNIISGYMEVPVEPDIPQKRLNQRGYCTEWELATTYRRSVEDIVVYSLEVEKYKSYFANGIATHNCPYAPTCPLLAQNLAPVTFPCPIETSIVHQFFQDYIEELNVDPTKLVEVSMVRDLVDQEVQYMRKTRILAQEHFIQENVVGVDSEGRVITKKELHQAVEFEDKIHKRREKLRSALLATRESRAKLGQTQLDTAQTISKIMSEVRMVEQQRSQALKLKLGIVDYDEYIDDNEQEITESGEG